MATKLEAEIALNVPVQVGPVEVDVRLVLWVVDFVVVDVVVVRVVDFVVVVVVLDDVALLVVVLVALPGTHW